MNTFRFVCLNKQWLGRPPACIPDWPPGRLAAWPPGCPHPETFNRIRPRENMVGALYRRIYIIHV